MDDIVERIILANKLDPDNVDEFGTDECFIDDSIRNLSDLDIVYSDYVKGHGKKLVKAFQEDVLGWMTGKKFVVDATEYDWTEHKDGDNDWDFPKVELTCILKGELGDEDLEVYIHFTDSDGEDRYGEVSGMTLKEAKKTFKGKKITPLEDIAKP